MRGLIKKTSNLGTSLQDFEKLRTGRIWNIYKLGISYVLKYYMYVRFQINPAQEKKKKAKYPLNLMVEPTNRCDLKCVFCPRQVMTRKQGDMKLSLFKSVIDDLRERKCLPFQIHMHFYGEPLLNPDLPKMIRIAKNAGVPIVRCNTNGTFLSSEKYCRELLESGVDLLTIVVEPTKEIHDKTRVNSDLDIVERNIRRLKSLRKKRKPPLFGETLALKGITSRVDLQEGFERWRRIFDLYDVVPASTVGGQVTDFDSRPRPKEFCREIWTDSVILWNGDVTVCWADPNAQFVMENVTNESLADIWNSKEYEKLRDIHRRGEYSKVPLCDQCIRVR
jgi:radical SAM protein with 4Fe4S-binding SPASM domain